MCTLGPPLGSTTKYVGLTQTCPDTMFFAYCYYTVIQVREFNEWVKRGILVQYLVYSLVFICVVQQTV